MRKVCTFLFCWLFIGLTYAAPFTLIDKPQPGALVRGQVTHADAIFYQGEALKISPDGWFVFGISRDASGEIALSWEAQGERFEKRYALPNREYKVQHIDGLPEKMVSPPQEVLARIRNDNQQVAKARAGNTDFVFFSQSFIWPAEGPISGVYGSQRVLNGQPKRPHYGVDVAAPVGTPVVAPADGVVTLFVPDMYYSGGTLIIDHGHQVTSTFIHLNKAHVSAGDKVEQGQLIAEIGDTGRVTGAHLDWRINWGRVRVDPQLLVPERD